MPFATPCAQPRHAIAAILVAANFMSSPGCRRTPSSGALPQFPQYLEFVSLTEKPDAAHTVAITDSDGTTWYREAVAALDLRDFAFERATASRGEGSWDVVACTRDPASAAKLSAWTGELMGKEVGVVCGGQLINIATVRSQLSSCLIAGRFDTQQQAESCAATLRAGGAPSPPATQP